MGLKTSQMKLTYLLSSLNPDFGVGKSCQLPGTLMGCKCFQIFKSPFLNGLCSKTQLKMLTCFFENFVLFLNFHETKRIGNDGIQTKDNQRLDQLDQSHYPQIFFLIRNFTTQMNKSVAGAVVWLSWQIGHFQHQRSEV